MNVCYKYFLSFPLTIDNEKYFISKIQRYVRDLSNEIWELNVNQFFLVFAKFSELNRSPCFDVADKVDFYRPLPIRKTYYGQLSVVLRNDQRHFETSCESES